MPLQATSGAASYDGFGGGAAAVPNYIEDVFSSYLWTGDGSSAQNINNGIDLAGKGGMVWVKGRSDATTHVIVDTNRFVSSSNIQNLFSDSTAAASASANEFGSFNSNGFSIPYNTTAGWTNFGTRTFASWTFRKQPKFFDVVTYTGTGSNTTIAHSLGSVPGSIIVKRTDTTAAWAVYHRSLANTQYLVLNTTAAAATGATWWNSTTPTSAVFSVGTDASVNASGGTYVAYLFAHDAGGFGLTGTDNVISCGLATVASADAVVTLGWEPQYVLYKQSDGVGAWTDVDSMRGLTVNQVANNSRVLFANNSNAEETNNGPALTATGFILPYVSGNSHGNGAYIYIAIRRGPMKVPTLGTSVFKPITAASDPTNVSVGFPTDLFLSNNRDGASGRYALSRLTGGPQYLTVTSSAAETTYAGTLFDLQNLFTSAVFYGSVNTVSYMFGRAPSFMDVVCYTGTGVARTITHNLAVAPELMIVKSRSDTANGVVYTASGGTGVYLRLFDASSSDSGNTSTAGALWNNTSPTSSVFSIGTSNQVNGSGVNYVAYLFATCAGVSKVGSYTGTGATQTINCGFTGGARFVLIKKSTSTAPDRDWYVWDTARGMVSGTDPSLKLNVTGAEVNADNIYTITTGFQIVSSADYVNASGVTYIFLAIA